MGTLRDDKGNDTLMRCTILVKLIPAKFQQNPFEIKHFA
jgi:hypothetical protein